MMRELPLHLERKRAETWRAMKEAGEEEEGVVVAVVDSEGVVTSEAVEDSVVDSEGVVTSEAVEDSVEIEEDSVVVAGPEEPGVDSVEVGEVFVEATTEEKAVLNSPNRHHHKFSNLKFCHFFKRIGWNFFHQFLAGFSAL